jgi:hypothetical protein
VGLTLNVEWNDGEMKSWTCKNEDIISTIFFRMHPKYVSFRKTHYFNIPVRQRSAAFGSGRAGYLWPDPGEQNFNVRLNCKDLQGQATNFIKAGYLLETRYLP